MINYFQEIVAYKDNNIESHLEKLNIIDIFSPIFTEYKDVGVSEKIIKFIVYAFTMGSPKIGVSNDRKKEKVKILSDLFIDQDKYYDDLILLKNKTVVDVAAKWLKHGDNRQIEYLITLQESYLQQQRAAISDIKKSDGVNIDFDQKYRCIEYSDKLKRMIKDAESELQQNDPKFKSVYSEVKSAQKKSSFGLETILKEQTQ